MKPDRQKIIERIRACLKYADPKANSNEHERDNAQRLANALIAKHKITKAEISGGPDITHIHSHVSTSGTSWDDIVTVFTVNGIKPEDVRGWNSGWEDIRKNVQNRICSECGYFGAGVKKGSSGEPLCKNCWE